ncbi:hypothetical protein ACOI1H_24340 [Loktanella sp. DJP18]|uniref:hypothetical protein n=1 Tax=Loktanella sp. DJP18 TaxID=3409788 RepID=UPI003BB57C93
MRIEFTKVAGIGAFLAALTASPVIAQDMDMGAWDGDSDGVLSQDEFNEGWGTNYGEDETAFSTWDEDGDGALNEDEYNNGVFNSYDDDESGVIEEPEFGDVGDDMGDGGFWDV